MSVTSNPNSEITFLELWAGNKIVARECASISLDYLSCKKNKGVRPDLCENEAKQVLQCTSNV